MRFHGIRFVKSWKLPETSLGLIGIWRRTEQHSTSHPHAWPDTHRPHCKLLTLAPCACRESSSTVKVFKNFKEVATVKPGFSAERIFGGALLAIAGTDFVCFYDWAQTKVCLPQAPFSARLSWAPSVFSTVP